MFRVHLAALNSLTYHGRDENGVVEDVHHELEVGWEGQDGVLRWGGFRGFQ